MPEQEESVMMPLARKKSATEAVMIDRDGYGAVRPLWAQGRSQKSIARELNLDIKTVREWVAAPWRPQTRKVPQCLTSDRVYFCSTHNTN